MTGMNEAIMNQNDQMRERIIEQKATLAELYKREATSKQLLIELEQRISSSELNIHGMTALTVEEAEFFEA